MAERDGIFKRREIWHVRVDPITGRQLTTGKSTRKDALAWVSERRAEAERIRRDPSYAAAQASFVDWCDIFLDRCEERGVRKVTRDLYAQKLGHWVRVLGEGATMNDVTKASVDRFVSSRRADGISAHTLHKECSVLVRMLKVAKRGGVWFGDLDTLVPEDITPQYVPRDRALPLAEVAALVAACPPVLAALVRVCVALGVRLSEALKLSPEDIDLEAKTVRIRGTKTAGSAREVPVLSLFLPLLEAALPMLPIAEKPNNLYRSFDVACRRAGVVYCTPNDLRRSHASILLESGTSPDVVRRLLGHTSDAMVRTVYGRTRPEALRELAEGAIARRVFVASSASDCVEPCRDDLASACNCVGALEKTTEYAPPARLPKPKVTRSNRVGSAGFVVSAGSVSRLCRVTPREALAFFAGNLGLLAGRAA